MLLLIYRTHVDIIVCFCMFYIQDGPKNQTVFESLKLPYMLTNSVRCIYQTVQYFIRSKIGVLYVTAFKYSLRNFSVTILFPK